MQPVVAAVDSPLDDGVYDQLVSLDEEDDDDDDEDDDDDDEPPPPLWPPQEWLA
jgi:hypothetical protein